MSERSRGPSLLVLLMVAAGLAMALLLAALWLAAEVPVAGWVNNMLWPWPSAVPRCW